MQLHHYVDLEVHQQQHIVDDRAVHSSVKHGRFLKSNKARYRLKGL